MNILIYGNVASGKTLLAELLQEYYEREGQPAAIIDDTFEKPWACSRRGHETHRREAERLLEKTLHNPAKHSIITTQASPGSIYRFYDGPHPYDDQATREALFDYYYHLVRKGPGEILPRPRDLRLRYPAYWGCF